MPRHKGVPNIKDRIKQNDIIILENLNFTWSMESIGICKRLWNSGTSLPEIAKQLKRECMEVFMLLYHMIEMGWIKEREGEMWGAKEKS